MHTLYYICIYIYISSISRRGAPSYAESFYETMRVHARLYTTERNLGERKYAISNPLFAYLPLSCT